MKILIIRSFPSLVNLKNNSYNQQEIGLATAMLSLGHQVGIVYFGDKCHSDETYVTKFGNVSIFYRKAKVFLKKIAVYEKFNNLKEEHDLLILNEYDQYETYRTLKSYAKKCVIYHGPYYESFNRRYNIYNKLYDILFLRNIKKLSPTIYTKSKMAKEYLERKGLKVKDFIGVGLDDNQFKNNQLINEINKSDDIQLLYIGKIEPRRNPDFLIDVLYTLNSNSVKKYHLTIIGNGEDKDVERLLKKIKDSYLDDFVTYEKSIPQNELPVIYQNSDFFLLPTSYEIWGMVLMEAMFFDIPVITTYNGGSSSLIQSGVNGEIIELSIEKWVNVIKNNNYNKIKLHEYNSKTISQKCNWNNIASIILKDRNEV